MSTPIYNPNYFFDNVPDALAPLSANTEYVACDTCGNNAPLHEIQVPHPTFTNEFGKAVVQLNAVALGGLNGLNA